MEPRGNFCISLCKCVIILIYGSFYQIEMEKKSKVKEKKRNRKKKERNDLIITINT